MKKLKMQRLAEISSNKRYKRLMCFSATLMAVKMMTTIKKTAAARKMSTLTSNKYSTSKMRSGCKYMEVVKQCLPEELFLTVTKLQQQLLSKRKTMKKLKKKKHQTLVSV